MADEPAFSFDPGDITLDELETLETHGVDFTLFQTAAVEGEMPSGGGYSKMMRALVFIVSRRADESFTWGDAGRMSLNEMTALLESVGSLEDPTPPAG